jgi:hypothetical protein
MAEVLGPTSTMPGSSHELPVGATRDLHPDQPAVARIQGVDAMPQVQPFLGMDGWVPVRDGDASARAIFDRHYSRRRYADGRKPKLIVGPGDKLLLLRADGSALFAWRRHKSHAGQEGVECSIFRREDGPLASILILEAEVPARGRWPGQRFYTFVNPRKVEPTMVRGHPVWGFCFYKADWRFAGLSKKAGLHILAKENRGVMADRFASVLAGRRINLALDAVAAGEAGWHELWPDDTESGLIVYHLNAGPKLLALCTDLIEGRA